MKEHDIQKYIWENREKWEDFIVKVTFPERHIFDEDEYSIHSLSPDKVLFNLYIDKLKSTYDNLKSLDLFGCEVPLKKEGDSTIRADLLGSFDGVAGIAIVEIKKDRQTERQAYTELFAYAAHLHGVFPTMNKEDITYVLISPMEERIVREATILSLLVDEKPVFAYIPSWENEDISTLKLTPWIPKQSDFIQITESVFSPKNIEIFKVTWDRIDDWNPKAGANPSNHMKERMDKITSYAAQLMEAKGIHGFVYTSQMYPEIPFLQNALIVAGINPFVAAINNYLLKKHELPVHKLDTISGIDVGLLDLIPELASKAKLVHEETHYLEGLTMTWGNTITGIAFDTVNLMTTKDQEERLEKSYGEMNWDQYQNIMLEDALCFNYSIKTTGLIRKLLVEYTKEDYQYLSKYGYENHPTLSHGDIPHYIVDYLTKHTYVRDFLTRLFDPYEDLQDLAEEDNN